MTAIFLDAILKIISCMIKKRGTMNRIQISKHFKAGISKIVQ